MGKIQATNCQSSKGAHFFTLTPQQQQQQQPRFDSADGEVDSKVEVGSTTLVHSRFHS